MRESSASSPERNRILAALPSRERTRLLRRLEPVVLSPGMMLQHGGQPARHVYFVTEGIVARRYIAENGDTLEYAITGPEGVIGITSFLGGGSTPSDAIVLVAGSAYRIPAAELMPELEGDRPLFRLLWRYTLALLEQAGQSAACNRHHSIEQQLSRWILACTDRLGSNTLAMTHEIIGSMLGVRRESITGAALTLQSQGLIDHSRGHFLILDRRGLEAHACECYRVDRRELERLLPLTATDPGPFRSSPGGTGSG